MRGRKRHLVLCRCLLIVVTLSMIVIVFKADPSTVKGWIRGCLCSETDTVNTARYSLGVKLDGDNTTGRTSRKQNNNKIGKLRNTE